MASVVVKNKKAMGHITMMIQASGISKMYAFTNYFLPSPTSHMKINF
jgi:hypothetical protein